VGLSLVPVVVEQDDRVERSFDIYSRLLRERIVFCGQEIDEPLANLIVAQLLFLESEDADRDINLYVNSPGGAAYAAFAIYDAMQHVLPDVCTICCGIAMSAAGMILAGGAPGKRFVLPHARMMIHQGSAGFRGSPADVEIAAREVAETTRQMAELIAHHSGRAFEQVMDDIDRDNFMSPAEAIEYGLIDAVLDPRRSGLEFAREGEQT
jgi:ATP-dependent Clp protease protease subunit